MNIGDKEEDTPLHLACSRRFIGASKLLVEAGERQSLIVLSALYTLNLAWEICISHYTSEFLSVSLFIYSFVPLVIDSV